MKSGKESKITTTVLYPQLWPHSFLSLTNARRDIKYDELTLEEFVAGYGQILQSPDIVEIERSARLKHLVSLMYFAQQYEWQAALSFHRAVLLEIERGLLKWGDSLFHLESRTLYGHPKAPPSSTSGGSSTSSTTVLSRFSTAILRANESGCGIFAPTAGCNHENKSNIALVRPNVPLPLHVRRQKTN